MDKKTKMKFNVLAIICIIVFAFALAPKTLQNDTFYTISIGEHIMENGIDRVDPFSWSDLKYTYPHWLYDVGIYLIYNLGGMTGIYISTIILSMILGVMLYVTNLKINKNNLFSFVLTMGVMFMMRDFLAARAQLVTFILFVTEILLIECFLETKKKRYAISLMAIAALIANLHAAVFYVFFVLMMPYFGEYIIILLRESHLSYKIRIKSLKRKIEKLTQKEAEQEKIEKVQSKLLQTEKNFAKFKENSDKRRENPYKVKLVKRDAVKWLIVVSILCLLMGLLTPIGDEPYTHIFKLLSGNTTQSISEHQPLVLASHRGAMVIMVMLLAMLIFTDTKVSLKDLFMIGGLTILTFSARRQLSLLLIIGVMSFTKIVCDFTNKYDKDGAEEFTRLMVTWKGKVLTIILLVICTIVMYKDKLNEEYISTSSYPVEATNYILREAEVRKSRFRNYENL